MYNCMVTGWLPLLWTPDTMILEGMFIIEQTTSMSSCKRSHTVMVSSNITKYEAECWSHLMGLHHNTHTECRGIRNKMEISPHTQAKSIRQLYCLAVMFCINPCCNFPFHVPSTDAIVTDSSHTQVLWPCLYSNEQCQVRCKIFY